MKYIVAVSGGVDSVVLLDMLVNAGTCELIVAHFDHGIRPDSAADSHFVAALAKKYGLPFYSKREELGEKASEELARNQRYKFLRELAKEHHATIVTAHHADDVIETVAINITRGTGWRGLAVFGAEDIERPLVAYKKRELYEYAVKHRLEWVEDSTNASPHYLRNRLRRQLYSLPSVTRGELLQLWREQRVVRGEIEAEVMRLFPQKAPFSRYFFTSIDDSSAVELLRAVVFVQTRRHLLHSQLKRGMLAIKTALPGAIVQLGEGVELSFTKTSFVALKGEKML